MKPIMKTNKNESAFPEVQKDPQFNSHTYGLTKREYFAAMALQGMVQVYDLRNDSSKHEAASLSVRMADNLINALNEV